MACIPCAIGPVLAIAGGMGAVGAMNKKDREKDNKKKMILYWLSFGTTTFTIIILSYFLFVKKTPCKSCIPR
jgi:hypothetical protein